jgi:hypothetical protein
MKMKLEREREMRKKEIINMSIEKCNRALGMEREVQYDKESKRDT